MRPSFLLAFVLGCGSAAPPVSPRASASTTVATAAPSSSAAPAAAGVSVATPDTPAGRQLGWVIDALAGGPAPTEGAASTHFTPDFLEKVPASQVVALLSQLDSQVGPVTLVRLETATDDRISAILKSRAGFLRLRLATEPTAPFRMGGLLIQPAMDLEPVPASWSDVEAKLRAVAPEVSFLAAQLGPTGCTKIEGSSEDQALAIGSTFKLYILAALGKQIAQGKHAWTDTLAIDDAEKSLPSGVMQDAPAGKTFPLRDFAAKMISISDNTAADHLLAFTGRGAVEAEVAASGHATPGRLVPFLSTRELFAYKLLLGPAEQQAYLAADVPRKRTLLAAMDKRDLGPALSSAASWTTPRAIDTVEWFASPNDLCKVAVELHGMGDEVASILSINPGVPDSAGAYKYIGFKGGSEPGVMAMSWILQRASDGAWLFLAAEFNDPNAPIDEAKGVAAAAAARAFLAKP